VWRPRSQAEFHAARRLSRENGQSVPIDWDPVDALVPDVTDRATLWELARMAGNAYKSDANDKKWYEIDPKWNNTPVGWDPDNAEGFRGHVFASSDNSTVVIAIKGTSVGLHVPTGHEDRRNDNLLFSCCCARVDFKWAFSTVCDCFSGSHRCDSSCLSNSVSEDDLFYAFGINLYHNITYLYPEANIWLVGHSLGGGLAALLGVTFGVPTVAFSSPGERTAAVRLHLPLSAQAETSITHVIHTADPVPYGLCGGGSLCARGGYALETRCHLGKVITYDTRARLGWGSDLLTHPIKVYIEKVLANEGPWPDEDEEREVPLARAEEDCVDCYKWEFGDFQNKLTVQA